MYKQKLDNLLQQELTRQEFLKAGGAILLTLVGLPTIINTVTKAFSSNPQPKLQSKQQSQGYGVRPYGR
jgi:hypothetical protein